MRGWAERRKTAHLALRLHHVLDHGQEGHLVLDALGQGQVALEAPIQGLALLGSLGHNNSGNLQTTGHVSSLDALG